MARLGPLFVAPKVPLKKFMRALFCVLSMEMRYINFFLGAQNGAFGVGQNVYVERVYVLFLSPTPPAQFAVPPDNQCLLINVTAVQILERCKGHTHKGHREKVLKVMNFRVFSGCF